SAWVDLLRSAAVLGPVVMQERLYLFNSAFQDRLFLTFAVRDDVTVRAGQYRLTVPPGGHSYQILDNAGELVESQRIGEPIGQSIGVRWDPPPSLLTPGLSAPFSLVSPQDATESLRGRLAARMDPMGTFIQLELADVDRQRTASVLEAVMERNV